MPSEFCQIHDIVAILHICDLRCGPNPPKTPSMEQTSYRVTAAKLATLNNQVLLFGADGNPRAMNPTALRIWEMFEYPAPIAEVARLLAAEFAMPEDAAAQSVERFVTAMMEAGLIAPAAPTDPARNRYLSLLKKATSNALYVEHELYMKHLELEGPAPDSKSRQRAYRDQAINFPDQLAAYRMSKYDGCTGTLRFSHTMIGKARLDNLERCAETVFADGIKGDFLEAGVCQGGAAIFLRALQVAHGAADRQTWVVDSFQGGPPAGLGRDADYDLVIAEEAIPTLAYSQAQVRDHFTRYGLLDDKVRFVEGWLSESLPGAGVGDLAILRIDVDLYSSTMDALELLYDRVVPGGFVIIDDYGLLPCCADAVNDFRDRHGVTEPILEIDPSGVFWRKAG